MLEAICARNHNLPGLEEMLARMRATNVRTRHFVRSLTETLAEHSFGNRNSLYVQHVIRLGVDAAEQALRLANVQASEIDYLVFVSCTGYMLPGPDAYIAAELGCRATMRRTPIQQLGCAAGISALAEAYKFVTGDPRARALVVAVELCSLSYQPEKQTTSDFISNALVSDGAAATVVFGANACGTEDAVTASGFTIENSMQHLLADSTDVIYGETSEIGLHFWTNPKVRHAVPQVAPALREFVSAHGWELSSLQFCVSHTGGPLIIDAVEQCLELPAGTVDHSRRSLAELGNCSSVSVLDVLLRHHDEPPPDQARGMVVAFGPGFTTEALIGTWRDIGSHSRSHCLQRPGRVQSGGEL
jgi:1,3,6,8-tetrahydroxynaphthalene synthase